MTDRDDLEREYGPFPQRDAAFRVFWLRLLGALGAVLLLLGLPFYSPGALFLAPHLILSAACVLGGILSFRRRAVRRAFWTTAVSGMLLPLATGYLFYQATQWPGGEQGFIYLLIVMPISCLAAILALLAIIGVWLLKI